MSNVIQLTEEEKHQVSEFFSNLSINAEVVEADWLSVVALLESKLGYMPWDEGKLIKFGRTSSLKSRVSSAISNKTNETYQEHINKGAKFVVLWAYDGKDNLQKAIQAEKRLNKHAWNKFQITDGYGGKKPDQSTTTFVYFFFTPVSVNVVTKNALLRKCGFCRDSFLLVNLKFCRELCGRKYCTSCLHADGQCCRCVGSNGHCEKFEHCVFPKCIDFTEEYEKENGQEDWREDYSDDDN
eukprot:gene16002-18051_t